MRRLTPIATIVLFAACQDGTTTSPKTLDLPTASAPTRRPPGAIDCGERCNQIAFERDGFPENGGYTTIYTIKPDGTGLAQVIVGGEQPTWSPNHQKLAFRAYAYSAGIATINANGTGMVGITTNTQDQDPKFSPDGTKIAFARYSTDGTNDLWIMNADGTQQTPITNTPGYSEYAPDFSPDGKYLVFVAYAPNSFNANIGVLDLATKTQKIISANQFHELNPSWSPDGKRIAFQTGTFGQNTGCIAVVDPDGSSRTEITANGLDCSAPSWSPDSKNLAFRIKANGLSLLATVDPKNPAAVTLVTKTQYLDSEPAWAR